VVALDRQFRDDGLARMHIGGVNVVRQAPAGFLVLAAETLSEDRTLRPLNVRRLLSLLRRLAMLHGPDYVFEPNGDAFRRRIQRGFEALLAVLYERGAFAGARASDGFRVSVGDPPNSRQSIDAGRLMVELKVAPSVPLEFLTVRLLRTGYRLAVEGP
jgi:phage tail sheath protein FI